MIPNPSPASFRRAALFTAVALAALSVDSRAQEVLLQEGFNTDGEAANPQRYTFTGRAAYEVPRIQSELTNFDQKGPIGWGHNFDVSYAGVPSIPARRMILTWKPGADISGANEDLLKVIDSSVDWLLKGKKNATIVVYPTLASIGGWADRLSAAGYTVLEDDATGTPDEQDVLGDLFIHASGGSNASRFVLAKKPVIVMSAPDYDDMLVGSIGTSATFAPGKVTIAAAGHPGAGGKTGSFDGYTADQSFELSGSFLPPSSTTLATVIRVVSPSVSNLGDVDAIIAGTKIHNQTVGTVTELDFADGTAGSWSNDNAIPGGYAGNWGLQAKGKLKVATAGTYRVAVGSDDGARLLIDLDKNGLTAADTIVDDAGPHGHQAVYTNVTFPTAGNYDYDLRSYNSGGGGSLEVSVAVQAGEIPDDALDSGYWEVLSTGGASPVTLLADSTITGFVASGPNVDVQLPLIVLSNGPDDVPPGAFYDGGPFTNFEGSGFLLAAGLNKFGAYPDGQNYRSVRLKSVNVAGKSKVKLTVALAGTVVDFEDSDFIDVVVYPKGPNSTPVTLAHFQGVQNAIQPWLADKQDNFIRRLTKQFADFTYDVPAGATDLVVELRVATSWWTEIAAIDNVRITAGDAKPISNVKAVAAGNNLHITFQDGTKPFVVRGAVSVDGPWVDLLTTDSNAVDLPLGLATGFFQVGEKAPNTVKLFKSILNGANERPAAVETPATGYGLLGLDTTNKKANYLVTYVGLKGDLTAAHLHGPGDATQAVGVLFGITPALPGSNRSGAFAGSVSVDDAKITAIQALNAYFNVHSTASPNGEIRGQLQNP